jgi:long-chain acyl-CoA synthetase
MKSLFRVKSKGLGKLDAKQQYLFISNHVSYLDPFVMAVSLGYRRLRSIYWAGGTDVAFTNNFTRFFSRLAQIVPIERKTKASLSLAFILSVLKKGKSLILFPEGRRSPSGELLEFAPGLSLILKNNPEIEVVPVVISGSFSAWPVQRFFPRPHSIKVYFNQPLLLKDIKDKSGGELSSQEITKILFEYLQKLKTDIEAQDAS